LLEFHYLCSRFLESLYVLRYTCFDADIFVYVISHVSFLLPPSLLKQLALLMMPVFF